MIKRPSAKDTEEDLLRFQEEFLASVGKVEPTKRTVTEPSATVYRKGGAPTKLSGGTADNNDDNDDDDGQGDPAWFPSISEPSVLGNVVERQFDASKLKPFAKTTSGFPAIEVLNERSLESGSNNTAKNRTGLSLFAQQMMAKSKSVDSAVIEQMNLKSKAKVDAKDEGDDDDDNAENEPGVVSMANSKEVTSKILAEVDAENKKKLAKMTAEEVSAECAELKSVLPPNLLQFLKSRKAGSTGSSALNTTGSSNQAPLASVQKSKQSSDKKESDSKSDHSKFIPSGFPAKPDSQWLHMDTVEGEKLEWTKDVPIGASAAKDLQAFETRFDFAGNVAVVPLGPPSDGEKNDEQMLEPAAELPPTASGLYHHGDEPDRPGYTLSELLELARSLSAQQRILALRTLAAICRNARAGKFVAAGLDKPVIPCLLEAGYAFTLRLALDDSSSEGNALAALTALHDLLVEPADEQLLEAYALGCSWISNGRRWPYLCDQAMSSPLSDEEMKKKDDAKMMSSDVIGCLVFRTNLIARLRYILCDWPIPSEKIPQLVLSILIRIARHSPACAQQIVGGSNGSRLVDKICCEQFLPSSFGERSEHLLSLTKGSLELLTAIAQAAPTAVSSRFDVNRLHFYVAPNVRNLEQSSVSLSLAALRLLTALCLAEVRPAKDLAFSLGQVFVENETILLSKATSDRCLSVDCLKYISGLLELFSSLTHKDNSETDAYDFESISCGLVEPIFMFFSEKFVAWLALPLSSQHQNALLLMLTSAYQLVASSPNAVERMVISPKFLKLTETALSMSVARSVARSSNSVVLLSISALKGQHQRNSESPLSLQYLDAISSTVVALENDNQQCEVVPWCLAAAVFNFFAQSSTSLIQEGTNLDFVKKCLLLPDIGTYFKLIATKRSPVGFANSFFQLHFELAFVCAYASCLTAFATNETNVGDFEHVKMFYTAVFKMLPLLPTSFDNCVWSVLFDGLIFSPQILKQFGRDGETLLTNIQSVRGVYRDALAVLEHGDKPFSFSQCAQVKDWLYFPLAAAGITVSIIGDQSSGEVEMPAIRHRVVVSVLRFTRFLLKSMPLIVLQELTPITHFVRLSSLYLNDDVFGGAAGEMEGVRGMLADCLTILLQLAKKYGSVAALNFSEKVPGLECTLPDFFIALLEQFKAASYGDVVFGNILLLFVTAIQPVIFRRLFWGDHREVLTFLRLRPEHLLLEIDSFLQPFESNIQVMNLYAEYVFNEIISDHLNTSAHGTRPVLWIIAVNHLNAFLFDSSSHKSGHSLRKSIWQAVAQQSSDEVSEIKKEKLRDLVFYKYSPPSTSGPAAEGPDVDLGGMQRYPALPQNRLIFLRSILGEEAGQSFILSLM